MRFTSSPRVVGEDWVMKTTLCDPSRNPMETTFASQSTAQLQSPRLTHQGLTILLVSLCCLPVVTIFMLWRYLPPVYEGKLQARVNAAGLPPAEYYQVPYDQRQPFVGGELIVKNDSSQDWTHLNITVNGYYQIWDVAPIPAGDTVRFNLDRFISRTGARFSLRYNQLKSVRIYARRPTRDRATFYHDFNTVPEG